METIKTYLHLPQLLLVVCTPCQSFSDAALQEGVTNAARGDKGIDIDEVLDPTLLRQLPCALVVSVPQQIVGEQAVQPLPAPGLVLDILDRVEGVELVEVGDAGGGLGVQAGLLGGVGRELALDAAHARDHGVHVAQDILLGRATRDGRRGRVLEQRLEGRRVLLDGEVGGPEVLSEELRGEPEEGLVLVS